MMYTSYFAKVRRLSNKYCPISIAQFKPKYFNGEEYREVAPDINTLMEFKETLDREKYIKEYKEKLSKLDASKVLEDINNIANGKIPVLVCYEVSGEFCHRHLLREWLNHMVS